MTNPATLANTTLRPATTNNALCLSALATQVFLTTYATHGIRPSIAREIAANYSENRFIERIAAPNTHIIIAEKAHHLIGFAQITLTSTLEFINAELPCELEKLYVQEPFTRMGLGARLLTAAEETARAHKASMLWLMHWVHNDRASRFYTQQGYTQIGTTQFKLENENHENIVCAKSFT